MVSRRVPLDTVAPLPFADGFVYGEGPRWHDGRLWFSDEPAGCVYSADHNGTLVVETEIPKASGLGWLSDETLLVSTLFDARLYQVDSSGQIAATVDLGDLGLTTNDLLVTAEGRTLPGHRRHHPRHSSARRLDGPHHGGARRRAGMRVALSRCRR